MVSRLLMWPASLLLAGLAGCASVPADWGRSDVEQMTADRGRVLSQPTDANEFTKRSLREPLTADIAVQLAMINNPAVRRETARLGFAAGEVYDAGRLANPVFSVARLSGDSSAGSNVPQLTLGIAFNFANLLFLPANTRYATAQFEAEKLSVASTALILAAEVEKAWFEAVGSDQLAQMREAAARAQKASADLAQRFFDAGNISARELAMERVAASQAMLVSISARAEAVEARSGLNRLMGLSADQSTWTLDARLAEPLSEEDDVPMLQRLALDSRLDVASLRRSAQAIADRYGFTRRTRVVNGIEIGVERERDFDGALDVGPTLSLELPLFNWGGGRVAAIQAALDQAEADLDAGVLDVSNEVQLAAAKVSANRALAQEYRSALIPQQEAVVGQAQKEQNYMLIGVFELILAKQQEYEAFAGYIESVRDYWTARAELARAVGRELPSAKQPAALTLDPTEVLKPKSGGMDHSKHSMGGMSHDMGSMKGGPMPDMNGMDHSQHEATKPSAPNIHEGHDMGDIPMKGMDHNTMGHDVPAPDPAIDETLADCEALKRVDLSKIDQSVRQALQIRCNSTDAQPDPHANHDMKDMSTKDTDEGAPDSAEPSPPPAAPHAH